MLGAVSISRIRYWDMLAARDVERTRMVTCCAYFDTCRAACPASSAPHVVQVTSFQRTAGRGFRGDGVDPGGVRDGEGEVGAERRGGAERSGHGSLESFLDDADAGGGGKGVGLAGLQPGFGGGAVRAGGSRPPDRLVGRGCRRPCIGASGIEGGIIWYGGVRGDIGCPGGLEGCI